MHKTVKFKNSQKVEYKIIWIAPAKEEEADGLCDNPATPKPKIWIDPNLRKRRKLKVLIEEVLHAHFWEKSEKDIRKCASNLRNIILSQVEILCNSKKNI